MGCGASKNDVVPASQNGGLPTTAEKNHSKQTDSMASNSPAGSERSTIPAYDSYQNNVSSESGRKMIDPPSKPPRANLKAEGDQLGKISRPEPVAFEVPVEDEEGMDGTSLIKRHPPRRLRKTIEDQQDESPVPVVTQQLLMEKVELANERRNQVLSKRVASARQKSARVPSRHVDLPLTEDVPHANGIRQP